MVRIAANDGAQAETVGELAGVWLQMQRHPGAAWQVGGVFDGELVLASGSPARPHLVAGTAGQYLHFLGDDEGTVEADAELTDQGAVLALVAGEPVEELLGAGFGDGAEMLHRFFTAHADAVVDNRHGAGLLVASILVEGDDDAEVRVVGDQRFVVQRLEAQAVDGIRGVGNELAQENLPVGIQGVDHQLEQLFGFGLEA